MQTIEGRGQRFAWGSLNDIPQFLGLPVTSEPYAEHWFGAHESAPSIAGGVGLDELISKHPDVLGSTSRRNFGDRLPYLVKLLAAAKPLSLQAHPDRAQAEEGFARENAAGVELTAVDRTYKDSWPKPECIIAITDFDGLVGFRDPIETAALFDQLGVAERLASVIAPLTQRKGAAAVTEVFLDVLGLEGPRLDLVDVVLEAAQTHVSSTGAVGEFARTAQQVDAAFPRDRGILAALLLNRVHLKPGEGVSLPPGNMHAYLNGFGLEVMANSDNVLRGGLTVKHIDVDQLLTVVDFTPGKPHTMAVDEIQPGVGRFATGAPEFGVWRLGPRATVSLPGEGARIVVVVDGSCALRGDDEIRLGAGEAAFVPADEAPVAEISGTTYVAAMGVAAGTSGMPTSATVH